jgi:hypothetical protein
MPADRLYARLPAHIRTQDAEGGHPLRALLAIAEAELDRLEADTAALYENVFIETCEEWVVPYLGDLLGARRLNPAGGFSLRAYVANTLDTRRAKGTAASVEQVARDVTGHPTRVVEFWRLLVQSQHVNHPRMGNLQTLDIRDGDAARQVGTPFDSAAHNLEIRPIKAGEGRYAIPNVGVFLWRLLAAPIGFAFPEGVGVMGGVVPRAAAPGRLRLHPAGVDLPLFNRPRGEPAIAHLAEERDLPAPLRRLPLWRELQARRAGKAMTGGYFGAQPVLRIRLGGVTLPPERIRIAHLGDRSDGSWRSPSVAGEVLLDPELGRLSLHANDAARPVEVALAQGAVGEVGAGPWDRRASFAEWFAPFAAPPGEPWIRVVTRRTEEHTANPANGGPCVGSLAQAIQDWNAAAQPLGVICILDNASYDEALPPIALAAGAQLAILAAAWPLTMDAGGARRRLVAQLLPAGRRPFIGRGLIVNGAGPGSALVLDGLMFAGGLRIGGRIGLVALHYATLGAAAAGLGAGISATSDAQVDEVTLYRSVLGPISLPEGAARFRATDSILGEDRSAEAGAGVLSSAMMLDTSGTDVALARCTVFGGIVARTADLDHVLATGRVRAARRQEGCVRYSLVPLGSRTAPRFRCQPDLAIAAEGAVSDARAAEIARRLLPRFTSARWEHPGFGQLHALCPTALAAGGEGGLEMGAFAAAGEPIRRDNLRLALGDTLRVGLTGGVFPVT